MRHQAPCVNLSVPLPTLIHGVAVTPYHCCNPPSSPTQPQGNNPNCAPAPAHVCMRRYMPIYRPLMAHRSSEVLRSLQISPEKAMFVVGVTSDLSDAVGGKTKALFIWALRLDGEGRHDRTWRTEAVNPVSSGPGWANWA
jgi:hypothetical protein